MLLITQQEIVNIAFSPRETMSPDFIRPSKIDIAQEHFVRPRIGDKIFEMLTDGQYEKLNDYYIKPALAYFIRFTIIEELAVQLGDQGAIVFTGGDDQNNSNQLQTENLDKNSTNTSINTKTIDSKINSTHGREVLEYDIKDILTEFETKNKESTQTDAVTTNNNLSEKDITTVGDMVNQERYHNEKFNNLDQVVVKDTVDNEKKLETIKASVTTDDQQKKEDMKKETDVDNRSESASNAQTIDKTEVASNIRSHKNFQPASSVLIHRLQVRALSDANVLITKAVKYIKRNPQIYGQFDVKPDIFFL